MLEPPGSNNQEFWTAGGLIPSDVDILRATVSFRPVATPEPANGPALVILCGLPGTGKSHFARQLISRSPFVWINSDRIRKTLVSAPEYSRQEHRRVFSAMNAITAEILRGGHSVVFDATNLNEQVRRPLYAVAQAAGVDPLIVRFTADPALVRQRLDDRAAGLNESSASDADWIIYTRMSVAEKDVPRPHLRVSRPEDTASVLEEVLRRTGWFNPSR